MILLYQWRGLLRRPQRFLEEPIFVLGGIRVANRRLYNSDLVVGEDALTKGVLAVALLEGASLFDGETDH